MYSRGILIVAAVLGCAVSQAQINLTHNGSTVDIDENFATVTNFIVGGTDQLFANSWYFRDGDGGTASLVSTISAPAVTLLGSSGARVVYADNSLTVTITYQLQGAVNGQTADLAETLIVDSVNGINLRLFQYSDFDMDGTFSGDTTTRMDSSTIMQEDGLASVTVGATPIPGFSEMSLFPTVRNSIVGVVGYNLNTTAGNGIGETMSGDMTFAYQWNQSIGDRGSFGVSTNKVLTVVPEPASLIALGFGALALLRRRKRK